MTRHLIASTTAAPAPSRPWLAISAALTSQVGVLAGRDDLTVTCAPGAGRGSPGVFIPALAAIEIDGTHLGHAPGTCDPTRPSDRERYPALWGVFTHEAAHARHSRWPQTRPNPATPTPIPSPGPSSGAREQAAVEAAMLLEESRIEAAHLRHRPGDRRWLRASATQLILADFTPAPNPQQATGGQAPQPRAAMTPWDAARAAALLLARVSAGVLDPDETSALAAEVEKILGGSRLSALAALWHIAHTTADDDHEAMLELGARWCTILGADPGQPLPDDTEENNEQDGSGEPSALTKAITTTLAAVAAADTPPAPPGPKAPNKARQRQEERRARGRAEQAARQVFAPGGNGGGPTAITGTRPPTRAEQTAARQLARHLRAAAHRERAAITVTSATPPGRLRMRGALAADAQRAAGATPTAEPFSRTVHRNVPAPPLRVGIACDVSGSMDAVTAPVASAAWILAKAVSHVPDARSATVIFGARVRPVTYPGRTPARVREFTATDWGHEFCHAVDALDAALELSRSGAARLLVIVSDGYFDEEEYTSGQARITRLIASGCGVLWLAPDDDDRIMRGAHAVTLTNPAEAAGAIGQAVTRTLRA
jgi:hypothetical protein